MTDSPNNLTRTIVRVFDSQASANAYNSDPVVLAAKATRDAFIAANGITESKTQGTR